jgi:hypothetical protein
MLKSDGLLDVDGPYHLHRHPGGWLYLAVVINPFNWQFVGRSMHAHI